jgi:hypothetical protein
MSTNSVLRVSKILIGYARSREYSVVYLVQMHIERTLYIASWEGKQTKIYTHVPNAFKLLSQPFYMKRKQKRNRRWCWRCGVSTTWVTPKPIWSWGINAFRIEVGQMGTHYKAPFANLSSRKLKSWLFWLHLSFWNLLTVLCCTSLFCSGKFWIFWFACLSYMLWKSCTELPLDPSLSRTLIEANELGCLSQALTVAAVLSAEITLRQTRRWPFLLYFM